MDIPRPLPPIMNVDACGLYCPAGDFYVDPERGVACAIITHPHSDHARRGSDVYICTHATVDLLKLRLGAKISVRSYDYGEVFELGKARVSFHPAGHMLGSAQVRIEAQGQVWVVTGDYKRESDPSCEPFEVVPCDTLVTEATFGTPAFVWKRTQPIGDEIIAWWHANRAAGITSLLLGYSLGKSQRLLAEIGLALGRKELTDAVWIHPSIHEGTEIYRRLGRTLAPTRTINDNDLASIPSRGSLILAPPSAKQSEWMSNLAPVEAAFASGWMQQSGGGYRSEVAKGFVVSDHADWPALLQTIAESGARQVYTFQRGRRGALVRHLKSQGIRADFVEVLRTESRLTKNGLASQLKLKL